MFRTFVDLDVSSTADAERYKPGLLLPLRKMLKNGSKVWVANSIITSTRFLNNGKLRVNLSSDKPPFRWTAGVVKKYNLTF
jgi:hypothetical protein